MNTRPGGRTDVFARAPWLTGPRLVLWARAFAIAFLCALALDVWTHSTHGVTDAQGEHLGRDFINYWSGAKLAADANGALAYDLEFLNAYQKSLVGPASEFKIYTYPPTALLLSLPLAALPFLPALALWSALGVGVCAQMLSRWLGWGAALTSLLASPATYLNLLSGQNGFFTAALLAGGLGAVARSPIAGGVMLGFLCYKPHFGLLVPVALAAGAHWRAFASAAATVSVLAGLSVLFLGMEAWSGFVRQSMLTTQILEHGAENWHRMPTVFTMFRMLGTGIGVAYALQAVSALGAAAAVARVWAGDRGASTRLACSLLAGFLATPYAWDYDMVCLLLAATLVARKGLKSGFLPWEKVTWLAVVVIPVPMMALGKWAGINPAPLVLWAALMMIVRRSALSRPLAAAAARSG